MFLFVILIGCLIQLINDCKGIETLEIESFNFAEEFLRDGRVFVNSSDLELPNDSGFEQIIAIRFSNIFIPKTINIINATIQFKTRSIAKKKNGNLSLIIRGELTANPTDFSSKIYQNISQRNITDSYSIWSPEKWETENESNEKQRTNNLGDIIQEIISLTEWFSGKDIVFLIERDESDSSLNTRIAGSGKDFGSPVLTIVYENVTCVDVSGIVDRFSQTCESWSTRNCAEYGKLIGMSDSEMVDVLTACPVSCRVCKINETIVEPESIETSSDILFPHWQSITANLWREESKTSGISAINTNNIALGSRNYSDILTAISFSSVKIPKTANISNSFIQFISDDENSQGNIILKITLETSRTIESLSNDNNNEELLYNLEKRNKTNNFILWDIGDWDFSGQKSSSQKTPDLSGIFNELISYDSWSDKNSDIVIFFERFSINDSGNNSRIAKCNILEEKGSTFDFRPILYFEYFSSAETRIVEAYASEYLEQSIETGESWSTSGDLELMNDSGDEQLVGIRFNNLDIPKFSIIKTATIQFTSKEIDNNNNNNISLLISAELNYSPSSFSEGYNFDLSNRKLTKTQINWSPSSWTIENERNEKQKTSELKDLINEVVNQNYWYAKNSIVIIIRRSDLDNNINSSRIAYSGYDNPNDGPMIHIEYETGACQDNPIFIDERGYLCENRKSANCTTGVTKLGLSLNGMSNLIYYCPLTCDICQVYVETSPAASPTYTPFQRTTFSPTATSSPSLLINPNEQQDDILIKSLPPVLGGLSIGIIVITVLKRRSSSSRNRQDIKLQNKRTKVQPTFDDIIHSINNNDDEENQIKIFEEEQKVQQEEVQQEVQQEENPISAQYYNDDEEEEVNFSQHSEDNEEETQSIGKNSTEMQIENIINEIEEQEEEEEEGEGEGENVIQTSQQYYDEDDSEEQEEEQEQEKEKEGAECEQKGGWSKESVWV